MATPCKVDDTASSDSWLFANRDDIPNCRIDDSEVSWPLRHRLLSEADATSQLHSLAHATTTIVDGFNVDSVSFQACKAYEGQDRHAVRQLDVHGKVWSLTAIFDGHVGTATSEYASQKLPLAVQDALRAAIVPTDPGELDPDAVASVLVAAIAAFDQGMIDDVLALLPGGLDGLPDLSDDEITKIFNDTETGGVNYAKAELLAHGSTALVSLVDPSHKHLWVANLGDCEAVLVSGSEPDDVRAEVLTRSQNGDNAAEVENMMRLHPGEEECALNGRVLGLIAVFRSLGDVGVKLPPVFVNRVLRKLDPPAYHFANNAAKWDATVPRNLTPPYMLNVAEVTHRVLSAPSSLLMYSDGVMERCEQRDASGQICGGKVPVDRFARELVRSDSGEDNRALRVLRHVISGDDLQKLSLCLTLEANVPWFDDITVIAQSLK